ncbi:inositol monophosphatase family protein [Nocardioides flavescens]|uniref:Inositol-1-monophosphatase n=1 Tax=Nocardioides flavescens TaxID=2691959 RepID=A0A6L7EMM0_9ACTN|nr:inositol monophosphatase [Nocardioides flavescens]
MSAPVEPAEPAELLDLAVEVAREAAELVREARARGVSVAATKSSEVDVVTEADRASERLIRERLVAARPDDAILGEEGDDRAGTSGVRWVVDPIDGTVNFVYGVPAYAVSIAAERDGEVVAGVVLNVATGTTYTATLDGPALRDGEPISVRDDAPLSQRLVATGFNYDAGLRERQAQALVRLLPRVRDIRRIGACSLDLCGVAEGTVDGYVEEGINLWDHAAGGLVAERAGARVEVGTGVLGRRMVIAAPSGGFDVLRRALVDAGYCD